MFSSFIFFLMLKLFYFRFLYRIYYSNIKRKGRTRIKLDAKKILLAKQLILKEATTTQIATELNISRTFAWRLRKNLVNGVSLHERVEDQITEKLEEQSENKSSIENYTKESGKEEEEEDENCNEELVDDTETKVEIPKTENLQVHNDQNINMSDIPNGFDGAETQFFKVESEPNDSDRNLSEDEDSDNDSLNHEQQDDQDCAQMAFFANQTPTEHLPCNKFDESTM